MLFWKKLTKALFGPGAKPRRRPSARPGVECLAERICPDAYNWVGAVPDHLGVGDGVHWADGLNWRSTDGERAALDGGPGVCDLAIINKGDLGSIVYDSQCSGTVAGLHLGAGDLELGVPMLTTELIMTGGSIFADAAGDALLVNCASGTSSWGGGSIGKEGGPPATVNFFHGTVLVTGGPSLYENLEIGSNNAEGGSATFKMVGAAVAVGMRANILVDANGTLYMTNNAPEDAISTFAAAPAIPVGGSMTGKMTVYGLMEVANQWAPNQPRRSTSVPIPVLGAGSGQINVRHANGLSVTGNASMTFAIDLQDGSSASVGLPMPGDRFVGLATLSASGRDTHVSRGAALHFFGDDDIWKSQTTASIDGVLDLGWLGGGIAWHTHVNIMQGGVLFNSSSRFLFWGSGSSGIVDEMWDLDKQATIQIFSGAVARPQVVPGTSWPGFTWNDILEASNIDGNFAVDPAAGNGWRFFGSGAPGSGPHNSDPTWGFNTVSWNVAFTA
jgi:hypothetical protein